MHHRGMLIGLSTIAALALGATVALAADEDPQIKLGKEMYMKYCATCHGPSATGEDGIASRLFTKRPTNLTTLAKENGGKFPMMEVINIVKGDQPIAAHGTREMPVWGTILGRPLEEGMYSQDAADAQLLNIGKYLESIQVK
ncbi:MAG TPA: c-type cytochrome [Candidatus Binatia bacterium]